MASSNNVNAIEKLKGSENYRTWAFAMKNFLQLEGLESCIQMETGDEAGLSRDRKAKARIILSIETHLFVHVQTLETAHAVWHRLKEIFEDKGLTRRISLLRQLITTKLEDFTSMENYVSKIIGTSQKLTEIGFDINDDWVGSILLAGLPDDFKPMIMAIENSGTKITGDIIISRLIDSDYNKNSESAFVGQNRKANGRYNQKKTFKCFGCGKPGHIERKCPNKKKNADERSSKEAKSVFCAALSVFDGSKNDWYLDSGASQHMIMKNEWLHNKVAIRVDYQLIISGSDNSKRE